MAGERGLESVTGGKGYIPLDATHTSAEAKVYSIMYRETITRGLKERHFSNQELMKMTGLRSDNTVRLALKGLREKLSIELVGHEKYFKYGQLYRIFTPKEIVERRTRAKLTIEPKTKKLTYGAPISVASPAATSAATPATSSADTTADFEGVVPQFLRDPSLLINTLINSDDSATASSSHGEIDDGERVAEVRRLFEQISNGGRWKDERDQAAYAEIAHVPLWHIILGLCYSVSRAQEHRMSTLGYAVPSILEHYEQMRVFPESQMVEVAYRTMRKTLICIQTGKWTIAEWEKNTLVPSG